MKNTKTSKKEQHEHAVIVCSIIGRRGWISGVLPIEFEVNELVSFRDQSGADKFGRIVRIQADLGEVGAGNEQYVTYTIKDENGKSFEVPFSNVRK